MIFCESRSTPLRNMTTCHGGCRVLMGESGHPGPRLQLVTHSMVLTDFSDCLGKQRSSSQNVKAGLQLLPHGKGQAVRRGLYVKKMWA